MRYILGLGKYLFPLSFLLYVALPLAKPETGADFVPDFLPFHLFWNYASGVLILAFIVSCLIGKLDRLATVLMALYVLLMIVLVHFPRAATSENDALNIFRNIMVIGALLVYARYATRDHRITG